MAMVDHIVELFLVLQWPTVTDRLGSRPKQTERAFLRCLIHFPEETLKSIMQCDHIQQTQKSVMRERKRTSCTCPSAVANGLHSWHWAVCSLNNNNNNNNHRWIADTALLIGWEELVHGGTWIVSLCISANRGPGHQTHQSDKSATSWWHECEN